MSVYKEANRQKLRFQTSKGPLAAEQLWDLSLTDLDTLAVSLEEEHATSGKKSFLVKKSVKDKTAKLRFDIVLDVLTTKAEEAEEARIVKENKEHNQKILGLIQEKQDDALKGKSIKQLQAELR